MPAATISRLNQIGRERVSGAISALFVADDPLANTMDWPGDPGLLGPGSVSWKVIGDVSAFVGGIRALLIQATHPEVVAGVSAHSRYRQDPLGRLGRTSAYVTATTFGAQAEADAAIAAVKRAHGPVKGMSHRGRDYSAQSPDLLSWVHNVLTDSFLWAYRRYGPGSLTREEADLFVVEQAAIGELVGADDLPTDARSLTRWVNEHPAVDASPGLGEAVEFLRRPPLPLHAGLAYQVLLGGALETIEQPLLDVVGLRRRAGSGLGTTALLIGLRGILGPVGPSKRAALQRCRAGGGS